MHVVNVLWAVLWIAPQALAQDSCAGQSFGSRAGDPEDSRKYILCLGFLGQIKSTCNEGYLFDEQTQGCVSENQAIHKVEDKDAKVEAKKELNIKQTINVDKPVIFNVFGNFNFFGSLWGNSQEPTTSGPPSLNPFMTKYSPKSSPEKITSSPVDKSSLFHKELHSSGHAPSAAIQLEGLSNKIPSESEKKSSTPENGQESESPSTREGQQEGINSSSENPLSTEASTKAAEELSSTESAIVSSTQDDKPSSENPLTTEASLEDIISSSENPLSTSPSADSSSTESPSENSTPETDSSSENPLTTEASLEEIISSSEDPLSTSPAEASSSTESPSESSTPEADSISENPLTTEASLEDIISNSEDPLSTSPAEASSSTESPSESSTPETDSSSENPLTTEASLEDIISSSEDPLSTSPADDSSSTESPSESSTPETDSSSENPLTTEATADDIIFSTENTLSTSPAEDLSSTESPSESSTQETDSSSENPLTTEASLEDIVSREPEPESSTEAGSEVQSSTEPSPKSSTEENISSSESPPTQEPPPDSSTAAVSPSPTESSQSTEIQSSTESSPESSTAAISSTEISPSGSTTKNINTSRKTPSVTDPIQSSTVESISSTKSSTASTGTTANGWESSTEPSAKSTTEKNLNIELTICRDLPNGVFLRDPKSCNQYYICNNGKAISEHCPHNLHFDIKKKVCNFPYLVNCSENEVPKAPGSTVNTNSNSTDLQEERTSCSGLPNGYFLRDPTSCNKYYICLNGKPTPARCPHNLNFDIVRKLCNFPYLVDCSAQATRPPKDLKDDWVPECKSARNGAYIRDPKSCRKFYICANGRALLRECPRGLYFDFELKFCNYPYLVECSVDETPVVRSP